MRKTILAAFLLLINDVYAGGNDSPRLFNENYYYRKTDERWFLFQEPESSEGMMDMFIDEPKYKGLSYAAIRRGVVESYKAQGFKIKYAKRKIISGPYVEENKIEFFYGKGVVTYVIYVEMANSEKIFSVSKTFGGAHDFDEGVFFMKKVGVAETAISEFLRKYEYKPVYKFERNDSN